MKQSLSFRLAVLAVSVVITSVLFESVADLGRPSGDAQVPIAHVVALPPLS